MSLQPDAFAPLQGEWADGYAIPTQSPVSLESEESDGVPWLKIAIGISAAYLAWRMYARHQLKKQTPRTADEAHSLLAKLWKEGSKAWLSLSQEPITTAYGVIPYSAGRALAVDYATELGEYISSTSADAVAQGFAAQMNAGWSSGVAWERAVEGYGLDPRQMRSYVSNLMKIEPEYGADTIPLQAQAALDRAVLVRADRLGINEAHKAVQVGKSMVWLAMAAQGDLPEGTKKKWVTAEDERVCAVCGPLDQVTIPLHWRFKTIGGEKFYAPGVHPNCRCDLELVYPDHKVDIVKAMPGDTWMGHGPIPDRDAKGQFAEVEGRKVKAPTTKTFSLKELSQPVQERTVSLSELTTASPTISLSELLAAPTISLNDLVPRETATISDKPSGNPTPEFNYEEALASATDFFNAEGIDPHPYLNPVRSVGMKIHLTSGEWTDKISGVTHAGISVDKDLFASPLFEVVYDREAETAGAEGLDFLKQALGTKIARLDEIAPTLTDDKYRLYRKAFSGLSKEQLLQLARVSLKSRDANAETPAFLGYSDDDEAMKELAKLNASEIATKIIWAEKMESDENFQTGAYRSHHSAWTQACNDVLNVASMGKGAQARAFDGLGNNPLDPITAAVFRFPWGWTGWTQSRGQSTIPASTKRVVIDGDYVIRRVTLVKVPKHLRTTPDTSQKKAGYYLAEERNTIERIAIIDLVPDPDSYPDLVEDPLDEENDINPNLFGGRPFNPPT